MLITPEDFDVCKHNKEEYDIKSFWLQILMLINLQ